MRERFEQIQGLAREGHSKEAIARQLGLNRKTVYKYLALDAPPQRRHTWRRGSTIAAYEGYMLRRWHQGRRNGRELWRELQDQGYAGAYQNVARIMAYLRQQEREGDRSPPAPTGLTVRRAVGILLTRAADRNDDEQRTVEQLKTLHPEIERALTLLAGFAGLVRASPLVDASGDLQRWLVEAPARERQPGWCYGTYERRPGHAPDDSWARGRVGEEFSFIRAVNSVQLKCFPCLPKDEGELPPSTSGKEEPNAARAHNTNPSILAARQVDRFAIPAHTLAAPLLRPCDSLAIDFGKRRSRKRFRLPSLLAGSRSSMIWRLP